MADTKKEKLEKIITPKGVAIFPWLNKPDTKFNPEGDYRVRLSIPPSDARDALVAKLQKMYDAVIKKAKADPKKKNKKIKQNDPPWVEELDEDGNETGNFVFAFKRKASGVKKDGSPWAIKPDLFNAKGEKLDPAAQVYGGSILKVSFTADGYDAGIGTGLALRLEGAQVIKLVEGQGRSASSYGFENEADDEDADQSDDDEADDEDDEDGEGDESGKAGDEF